MAIFLLVFTLMVLSMLGLMLGALAGRPPIKGSCGGLACIEGAGCGACPKRDRKDDRA